MIYLPHDIQIQPAHKDEIPQIKILMENTFGQFPKLEELFLKWITHSQYSVFVAKIESKIIGVSTWYIKEGDDLSKYISFGQFAINYMLNQKIAWVLNLAVHPDYRRNKISYRLSIAHFHWLKEQNCSVVVGSSWVSGSDNNSQHLFLKAGFDKLGESKVFLRDQMQNGAICSVCQNSECHCLSILYGISVSKLLSLGLN